MILFLDIKDINEIPVSSQKRLFRDFLLLDSVTNAGKSKISKIEKGKPEKKSKKLKSPTIGKQTDFQFSRLMIDDIQALMSMNEADFGKSQGLKKDLEAIANGKLVFVAKN